MKGLLLILTSIVMQPTMAAPDFLPAVPVFKGKYELHSQALCATAKQTLAYLNKGSAYDPQMIHEGKVFKIPLARVKETLIFICKNQHHLNDPDFIKMHFDFIRWYPDRIRAKQLAHNKPLLNHLPSDRLLMTKYFVHLANANTKPSAAKPYPLYGLPADEQHLTLDEANTKPDLIRFQYGKQAILKGVLNNKPVPALAYLSRDDVETALLQGTIVANFGHGQGTKIFNVHRNNNIAYDRTKPPYSQERFWYFKKVDGIKGYGKDAEHKITVNPEVTFAADITQFGLGKLLMIQYLGKGGVMVTKAGIFADTGGAFADNLYQIDYLAGSYHGQDDFYRATRNLPDYVNAYFMILKKSVR